MNEDNSFTRFFAGHRDGDHSHEVALAFQEAVAATTQTGGDSSVTVKYKVTSASKGCVLLEDEVTVKLPKQKSPAAIYYADKSNNLVRDNPNQIHLDLKTVPTVAAPDEPLKTVTLATQ